MQVNFVEYPTFYIKGILFVLWMVAGHSFLPYHIVEK